MSFPYCDFSAARASPRPSNEYKICIFLHRWFSAAWLCRAGRLLLLFPRRACDQENCFPNKCKLLQSHLVTRNDVYEMIKQKGLCLSCAKKQDNNDGAHQCQLIVPGRNGKEAFSVLCERNCKYKGVILNRGWCRCKMAKLKENRAEVSSNNTGNGDRGNGKEVQSASLVMSANTVIRCNGMTWDSISL